MFLNFYAIKAIIESNEISELKGGGEFRVCVPLVSFGKFRDFRKRFIKAT